MRDAIAIDFDGCLCVNKFPDIGAPNWAVIAKAKERQAAGAGLILWTCREGLLLRAAVQACREWGLTFDAINESLRDIAERDAINRFTTAEVKIDMTGMLNKTAKAFGINGFSGLSLCFTLYFHFIRAPARS